MKTTNYSLLAIKILIAGTMSLVYGVIIGAQTVGISAAGDITYKVETVQDQKKLDTMTTIMKYEKHLDTLSPVQN